MAGGNTCKETVTRYWNKMKFAFLWNPALRKTFLTAASVHLYAKFQYSTYLRQLLYIFIGSIVLNLFMVVFVSLPFYFDGSADILTYVAGTTNCFLHSAFLVLHRLRPKAFRKFHWAIVVVSSISIRLTVQSIARVMPHFLIVKIPCVMLLVVILTIYCQQSTLVTAGFILTFSWVNVEQEIGQHTDTSYEEASDLNRFHFPAL